MAKKVQIAKGILVSKDKEKSMQNKSGGSNVGKYKNVKSENLAGPSGGAPQGSFPINNLSRAKSALKFAHFAPNPEGIRKKVYDKYPQLKKGKI